MDVATLLLHQPTLRDQVYQTVYQYCYTLKYGLNNEADVADLPYQFLYQDLHMSDLAANYLAPQLMRRYQQPVPRSQAEAVPTAAQGPTTIGKVLKTAYYSTVSQSFPARTRYGEPGSASKKEQPVTLYAPALYGAPAVHADPPTTAMN